MAPGVPRIGSRHDRPRAAGAANHCMSGTKTGAFNGDRHAALGSAAAFRENGPFEPDFLNGLDRSAIVFLGAQQAFPAMRQAQPKFAVVFIAGIDRQLSALVHLILKEIAGFEHWDHHNKSPAHRGLDALATQQAGVCSATLKRGDQTGMASQVREFWCGTRPPIAGPSGPTCSRAARSPAVETSELVPAWKHCEPEIFRACAARGWSGRLPLLNHTCL